MLASVKHPAESSRLDQTGHPPGRDRPWEGMGKNMCPMTPSLVAPGSPKWLGDWHPCSEPGMFSRDGELFASSLQP